MHLIFRSHILKKFKVKRVWTKIAKDYHISEVIHDIMLMKPKQWKSYIMIVDLLNKYFDLFKI